MIDGNIHKEIDERIDEGKVDEAIDENLMNESMIQLMSLTRQSLLLYRIQVMQLLVVMMLTLTPSLIMTVHQW